MLDIAVTFDGSSRSGNKAFVIKIESTHFRQ